jgi:hypothetical protein
MGKPRPVKEGAKWRLKVDVAGGSSHSVHVQLPDRDVLNNSYVRYLARQLLVDENDLDDVLENWTADQLQKHLENQDPDALRSRIFGIKKSRS